MKIQIEKVLREYKTKRSQVDTTNARIEAYKDVINNPQLVADWSYTTYEKELGMPGSPNRNTSSPVEKEAEAKELTKEVIKEWIEVEKARIFKTKLEVEQIESALNALTKMERYIIELKYFDKLNWRDIESNVNQQFRQQRYITDSGIKKINTQILTTLQTILEPFYDKVA